MTDLVGNILSGDATYGIREDIAEPALGEEPVQGAALQISSRTSGALEPSGDAHPDFFPAKRDWVLKVLVKRVEDNGGALQFAPNVFLELSFGTGAAKLDQRIPVPMSGLTMAITDQHVIAKLSVEGNITPGVLDTTVSIVPGNLATFNVSQQIIEDTPTLRVPEYAVGVVGLTANAIGTAQVVSTGLWLFSTDSPSPIVAGAGIPNQPLRAWNGPAVIPIDVSFPMGTIGAVAVPASANAIQLQAFAANMIHHLQWVIQQ